MIYHGVMAGIGNDLVREARRRAGLSQRSLAELAGTTQSAIARLEAGRTTPSFDTVVRLVRLCGFDLEVALVEPDVSDWAQALPLLRLTAAERLDRAERVAAQLQRLQGKATRGSGVA
jgi:transcriptional regulator with XRE-family HTH domain